MRSARLWNMVGFQTKLKHGEQVRLFRTIPGLERAEFARLGGLHRNTFINSPKLLDGTLRLKAAPHIRFAGQITGCEGYVELAAIGLLAGRFAAAELAARRSRPLPPTTALGALLGHITGGADADIYQPMNVNFGLFPPIEGRAKKAERKQPTPTGRERISPSGWHEPFRRRRGIQLGVPGDVEAPTPASAGGEDLLAAHRFGRAASPPWGGRREFGAVEGAVAIGVGARRTCRRCATAHSSNDSRPS